MALKKKFRVYATQGQGKVLAERFSTLTAAEDYVREHSKEASFAIRFPDNSWYDWSKTRVASQKRKT